MIKYDFNTQIVLIIITMTKYLKKGIYLEISIFILTFVLIIFGLSSSSVRFSNSRINPCFLSTASGRCYNKQKYHHLSMLYIVMQKGDINLLKTYTFVTMLI